MVCYLIALGLLATVGLIIGASVFYFVGLMLAEGVALYHYALIRERQPEGCFRAFLHNNWFGVAVFAGIVLDYL